MTDVLIASHDQAVHAIRKYLNQHASYPSPTGKPDPDCPACEGKGWFATEEVDQEHCHCRCPWCSGCDEPLCFGPCPTVEVIAERLDLIADVPYLPQGDTRP